MPRKTSRARGVATQGPVGPAAAAAPRLPVKAGPPNPAAPTAAEALERLHLDPASDGDPPPPPPPVTEPEAPPPSQPPPVEASSSGRSEAGGSLEQEAVRKLHELAEAGGEEVALTEEEVRANDQRQEDEVILCSFCVCLFRTGISSRSIA